MKNLIIQQQSLPIMKETIAHNRMTPAVSIATDEGLISYMALFFLLYVTTSIAALLSNNWDDVMLEDRSEIINSIHRV